MSTERPPQVWLVCRTHDVRFKNRTVVAQEHTRPGCDVHIELSEETRKRDAS